MSDERNINLNGDNTAGLVVLAWILAGFLFMGEPDITDSLIRLLQAMAVYCEQFAQKGHA